MAGRPKRRALVAALKSIAEVETDEELDNWLIEQTVAGDTVPGLTRRVRDSQSWKDSGFLEPDNALLYTWLSRNPDISERISRARKDAAHAFADKAADAGDTTNEANARASAVKLKAYQWNAERRNREAYGQAPTSVINNMDIGGVYLQVLKMRVVSPSLPDVNEGRDALDAIAGAVPALEAPPFEPTAAVVEKTRYPSGTPAPPSDS